MFVFLDHNGRYLLNECNEIYVTNNPYAYELNKFGFCSCYELYKDGTKGKLVCHERFANRFSPVILIDLPAQLSIARSAAMISYAS